jgi:hypothetical protein
MKIFNKGISKNSKIALSHRERGFIAVHLGVMP